MWYPNIQQVTSLAKPLQEQEIMNWCTNESLKIKINKNTQILSYQTKHFFFLIVDYTTFI